MISRNRLLFKASATEAEHLPKGFLKGVALSVFQNSSDATSNWTEFIKKRNYLGQPQNKEAFQRSNDFWDLWVVAASMESTACHEKAGALAC
jgi:hypothetical protein